VFSIDLTPKGITWTCTIAPCAAQGLLTNPLEAAQAAIAHRDEKHPGHVWSSRFEEACRVAEVFLKNRDLYLWHGDGTHSQLALPELVAALAGSLTPPGIVLPTPVAPVSNAEDWGRSPLTEENMGDPRLIELPKSTSPTRNWTTNHQVRWSVGEAIQSPPEGRGCQVRGARVGGDVEVCALPGHNPANIKHVFAIGERVTRIAHN
jgi:hypothetical protein